MRRRCNVLFAATDDYVGDGDDDVEYDEVEDDEVEDGDDDEVEDDEVEDGDDDADDADDDDDDHDDDNDAELDDVEDDDDLTTMCRRVVFMNSNAFFPFSLSHDRWSRDKAWRGSLSPSLNEEWLWSKSI